MNCHEAQQLSAFARPGVAELDAADVAALERHLADCTECRSVFRSERRHDEALAQRFLAVPIPGGAHNRVIGRLRSDRTAWWRTRLLGSAAVVIAIVLASTVWERSSRPTFDPNAVALAAYEQSGQWRLADEARMSVERWLRGIDASLAAPAEWKYRYVTFLGRSDFEGVKSVPTIVLSRGDATARIYVVRDNAFRNLDGYDLPIEEGGWTVVVRRYPDLPGWVLIAVIGGGPVDLFLHPPTPADAA